MLNLEPLFEAVDLIELVERAGGHPKRRGRGGECACPLHGGDNPSAFSVYTDGEGRQRWHCFTGCQTGGDAVEFVQRWKGLDFTEALKWLADYARISLEELGWTPQAAAEHKRQASVTDLLTRAAKFYQLQLWGSPSPPSPLPLGEGSTKALEYARSRGFSDEHLKTVMWGFTRSDDALMKAMLKAEDSTALLPLAREIGLVRADGKDFTANADGEKVSPDGWLIYPHRVGGKVVSLSARAISPVEKGSKSRNLPGKRHLYRAEMGLDGRPLDNEGLLIVEGPADAETVRLWGWPTWALCGCTLREDEEPHLVAALQRKAERTTVYVALSNDTAGHQGAERLAEIAGPLARIVLWPKADGAKKSDANDWLQHGGTAELAEALLCEAPPHLDLEIQRVKKIRDTRERAEGIEHLADLVARLGETERMLYLKRIGEDRKLEIGAKEFAKMVADRMPKNDRSSGIEVLDGKFCYWGEPMCNFTAKLIHELSVDDGQNTPVINYTVEGKLAGGPALPSIDVEAEGFDGMKWVGKTWGARPIVYLNNGKLHLLRRAILEAGQKTMTRERVHTFTGWYEVGGERAFLSASGALSAKGLDGSARVDLPNNLAHYKLPVPPSGEGLVEAIKASLRFLEIAPLGITVPLWAAMYAAPLTMIKSLNAVLWVYGPTQSKKSTISHLALAHFGEGFVQGRDYKAPKDWTSTQADLEGTMFTCKDVALIIDDYAPQFTSSQESKDISKRAHYVVRSVGNRSSRGRRRADMSARTQFLPRGLVITTAEQPLIGQSIVGRTITVPIEWGSVNLERLTAAQGEHGYYSQAMAGYVTWLGAHWDSVAAELPALYTDLQTQVQDRFCNQDRLTDYFAVLSSGARIALRWMDELGAVDDLEYRLVQYDEALYQLLVGQSERISQQSPVLRFFQAIEDLCTQGSVVLAPKGKLDFAAPFGATLIGWKDESLLYILTAPALVEVKKYWAGLDERFDTLIDALRREIWQYGYLFERDDRQFEVVKWLNAKVGHKRVLLVNGEAVHERLGVDLLSEPEPAPILLDGDPRA